MAPGQEIIFVNVCLGFVLNAHQSSREVSRRTVPPSVFLVLNSRRRENKNFGDRSISGSVFNSAATVTKLKRIRL